MNARAKLALAAHRLRTHGWCQGVEVDAQGRMCLIGALNPRPVPRPASDQQAIDALRFATVGRSLTVWNDRTGRTLSEVLAAIDRAIASLPDSGRDLFVSAPGHGHVTVRRASGVPRALARLFGRGAFLHDGAVVRATAKGLETINPGPIELFATGV